MKFTTNIKGLKINSVNTTGDVAAPVVEVEELEVKQEFTSHEIVQLQDSTWKKFREIFNKRTVLHMVDTVIEAEQKGHRARIADIDNEAELAIHGGRASLMKDIAFKNLAKKAKEHLDNKTETDPSEAAPQQQEAGDVLEFIVNFMKAMSEKDAAQNEK